LRYKRREREIAYRRAFQLRGEPAPAKFVWGGLKLAVLHLLASGLTRLADTPPEGLSWVQR
jgi:hypothetical protein